MRIIVISDTHGNFISLESVFMRNTDADWFIHLGDGERELNRFISEHSIFTSKIIHVAGNCDINSLSHDVFTLPVMGHKILATHGHRFNVNYSLNEIKKLASENECDIILYGHTHSRFKSYENGVWIMNPGSASCPRDGKKTSFGSIDISQTGIIMNITDI